MKSCVREALVGLFLVLVGSVALAFVYSQASALPLCGGNNHQWQAPVVCTNTKTIDGSLVTVVLSEQADGYTTIDFSLAAPRTTDTFIRSTSHQGFSANGGPATDPRGFIPAGTVGPVRLVIPQALCGQIDNRAVFDDKTGRVAGPWINNGSCAAAIVTTAPTTTATTPPSQGVSAPSTTAGTTRPSPAVVRPLPATGGGDHGLLPTIFVVLGLGVLLWGTSAYGRRTA